MICRADVPAASKLRDGNAVSERREWDVDLVSTQVELGRSQVLRLWSQEVEYPTVWSFGAKIMSETGAVCDFINDSGPRCGVEVVGPTFRRLVLRDAAEGIREEGASGASAFLKDQNPTEWSAEPDSIRLEGWWTTRESMLALWP